MPLSLLGVAVEELTQFIGALMVESLLYGVHLVLFCIAAHRLCPRELTLKLIIFVALVLLLVLATADIALSYRFILRDFPAIVEGRLTLAQAVRRLLQKNVLQVSGNLLADGLLLYRFYMIWGQRPLHVVLPLLVLLAETVFGYISQVKHRTTKITYTFTPIYLWSTFVYNIVMTLLTAGRIWWVSRKTLIEHSTQRKRYNTAIAILVESGALYSISILLLLVSPTKNGWHYFFTILPYRLVGIVPTLMVVQVELRRKSMRNQSSIISASAAVMSTVDTNSNV